MTTPPSLPNAASAYAFGWIVDTLDGRRQIWHNGGVVGSSTRNCWFPDQHVAVVVFGTAIDFDPGLVVRAAMRVVEPPSAAAVAAKASPAAGEDAAITVRARREYAAWTNNSVDLTLYDIQMREALSSTTIAAVARVLAGAGTPTAFVFAGREQVGETNVYRYRVETPNAPLVMTIAYDTTGKIAGLHFSPAP